MRFFALFCLKLHLFALSTALISAPPAYRRFSPKRLRKKLAKHTSVPSIRHSIAGKVCRIICTGGSGPHPA
jgi:hypothetical protein